MKRWTAFVLGLVLLAQISLGQTVPNKPAAEKTADKPPAKPETTPKIQWKVPRPNIVLIVADDLGFSDLGCYGSDLRTPNLDRLARRGIRFSQFYTAAQCCPTRAALLTGLYPHQTGIGHMMDDLSRPAYRGNLNQSCVTAAELLSAAGYQTMMCGKWHVTRYENAATATKINWPTQRGFEQFFGTLGDGGSYFQPPTLTRGSNPSPISPDFYYTDAISDQAGRYIEQASRLTNKPFFLYVAYTAPHWPLQARPELISRYRGKFAVGWDDIRQDRIQRQTSLGLIRREWRLSTRDSRVPMWEQAADRDWQQRRIEVYAAQVDSLDQGVGRILEKLQQYGFEQNTLVVFLSDNGASADELGTDPTGLPVAAKTRDGRPVRVGNIPGVAPGDEATFQSYGVGWANVSNTPFRGYQRSVYEGGIASPLIVSWPAIMPEAGHVVHDLAHVIDIVPTLVDAARTQYPTLMAGRDIRPMEGESLMPILFGSRRIRGPMFWEHEGNRAIRDGRWKLLARQGGPWELYDMDADRTEMNDMVKRFQVIAKDLYSEYQTWAKRVGVEPWGAQTEQPAAKPSGTFQPRRAPGTSL